MCLSCILLTLLLLGSANGAPVLARKFLQDRYAWPVDGGIKLHDGQPLFGKAKTWRGLFTSIGLTNVIAWLIGLAPLLGTEFAIWAMAGDLFASFCKRRMGKAESSRARVFDRIPESLLPLWLLKETLGLSLIDIVLSVALFFLLEEFGSPLLYKWHIRRRPY